MGLDFGKTAQQTMTAVPEEKNEIEVVKEYDIVADRQQMNADLVNSKEVDDLVSTIEVRFLHRTIRSPRKHPCNSGPTGRSPARIPR